MILFWIGLVAQATPQLQQMAQGTFTLSVPMEEMERERDRALRETLDASNIVVRTIAESKLENNPHICRSYVIETASNAMSVTCDEKPTINIKLDGTPTQYPIEDGTFLEVIANVESDRVVQKFQGENGGLEVLYQFTAGELLVTKTIS